MPNDPIEFTVTVTIGGGGGGGDDEKVKASGTDAIADYLFPKLEEGAGINIDLNNSVANELVTIESETIQTIVPFAYNAVSPLALYTTGNNETIISVKLYIDTLFDGTVTISIGETGNIQRLMTTSENDPYSIGNYETEPAIEYLASTIIRLYISAVGSTAGNGRVIILSKRI